MTTVAILHPIDPAGYVPSGIDSFIRGILKFSPPDIQYTLFGATSDPLTRPVGSRVSATIGDRTIHYWPLVSMDPNAGRSLVPLTIRFLHSLRKFRSAGLLDDFDILDFHRIEPAGLFFGDPRPKNLLLHQDMSVIRSKDSDILWRYAPWLYEYFEQRVFRTVDRVFAVRQSAVQRYSLLYPALAGRFSFIPTWVDSTVFFPNSDDEARRIQRHKLRTELNIEAETQIVVFVGRLDQQKDPLLLIEAFRLAASRREALHLVIIGDGALRARVSAVVRESGLTSRVSFVGVQPGPAIAAMLRAADVFVLSSAYEGMPIAVLEALASGLPVVSTDVGEIGLVVRDGVNGKIAGERSARALSDALSETLEGVERMRGRPCEAAIQPYLPQTVLSTVFDNHRSQAQRRCDVKAVCSQ